MVGHRRSNWIGIGTLLLILIFVSCEKETQESAAVDSVTATTDYTQLVSSTVVVERAALRPTLFASGVVKGQHEVLVKARTSGVVNSIDFSLGQQVEQGQTLVVLDDTIAKLSASQISLQVQNARKELDVQNQLYDRGAISLSILNQTKSALDGLEAQLERAQETLRDTTISAPIAGSIADEGISLILGDTVQAGQTITRIIDLNEMRIALSLGQSQIFFVQDGAKATIEIITPNEVIRAEGVVGAVSSGSDPRTGSWTAFVDFTNPRPDLIRAGVSANVTIKNDLAPLHPLVPNAAMVNREGKTYVYVKQENSARLVEVEVLDRYGDLMAVEPIDDSYDLVGKEVLTSGLSRIDDETSIVTQYE
jgi:RND family efflux transporter MFP subunit